MSRAKAKCVAITGGTHGNETNGVYLAKHFMANPALVKRESFETVVMLTNVASIKANRRFVGKPSSGIVGSSPRRARLA